MSICLTFSVLVRNPISSLHNRDDFLILCVGCSRVALCVRFWGFCLLSAYLVKCERVVNLEGLALYDDEAISSSFCNLRDSTRNLG